MSETKAKKDNFLLNIGCNVIIPSVIMTKYSTPETLGQVRGLLIALAFPLCYGLFDLIQKKKVNFFSALGLFSILITGGIGLLSLDKNWMIVKETAIPALMGIAVFISQKTETPIVKTFLNQMLDLDKIKDAFKDKNLEDDFEKTLSRSSIFLGCTFFVSAILNFVLAVIILKGQPGSVEFNESLGKMTALSFPVITIPMMIMVSLIMMYLFKGIKNKTDLEIESIFRQ